ncbi:MAG TPA: hypothetical protein VFE37_15235 [Chloroflexota bacterium]|nr:hypothetical protein [Chloroflexota bacterium]
MSYAAPLPDFTRLALAGSFELAGLPCTLQVGPIEHFADYGPHFDVVHLQVLHDGQPLAIADLNPAIEPARGYQLWSDLCASIQDAVGDAYALGPSEEAEPNPRLGCWGPRPDFLGQGDSDCFTALVIGVAVDTRVAAQRPTSAALAQALAAAVLRELREWERVARADAHR